MENKNINWVYDHAQTLEVIDVRNPQEFQEGHLPFAKNIPIFTAMFNPENHFLKTKKYYLYCHTGTRVAKVINELAPQGYQMVNCTGVINLKDRPLIK